MASKINGAYTAIVTPFDKAGNLDWEAFEALLSHQITGGIDGVVISGTTGESPTLTVQEKIALVRKARAFLPDSIKVMAGSGGNDTNSSVELSKLATDAGADSLLIVTPPYNKPSLKGLELHFQSIADAVNVPLCLYHVPSRTGQLLSWQDLSTLCKIPKIIAVKEASGDVALFSRAESTSEAAYMSGEDATFLPSLAVGGQGVISVVTNIFPKAFKQMLESYRSGDSSRATAIHKTLLPLIDLLFCEANPAPAKAVLSHMNLCQNYLRAPMVPVTPSNAEALIATTEETAGRLIDLGAG